MGSGSRFEMRLVSAFGISVYYDRFPHQHSFSLLLGCVSIYIGIGKGYDEQ
jgi:hypothetical protein